MGVRHRRFQSYLLFLSLWLVCLPACGKKDPPIIPRIITPQAVTDLKAEAGCGKILLSFSKPEMNSDGSPFNDLYGFQVYRRVLKARIDPTAPTPVADQQIDSDDGTTDEIETAKSNGLPPTVGGDPFSSSGTDSKAGEDNERTKAGQDADEALSKLSWVPVKKNFKKIKEYSMKELADLNKDAVVSRDPATGKSAAGNRGLVGGTSVEGKDDVPTEMRIPVQFIDNGEGLGEDFESETGYLFQYQYKIRLINENDDYSPFSNTAVVIYRTVPRAPSDIQWQPQGNSVDIAWEPPMELCNGRPLEGLVFFNIYRQTKGQRPSTRPINMEPIREFHYRIDHLDTDISYVFTIRSVMKEPFRQSETTAKVDVIIPDITPPPVPSGLVGIGGFQLVSLLWDPVQARDLKGYNVYRRAVDVEEWTLITKEPLTGTTLVDRGIDMSRDYFYAVTSVDGSPQANESDKSVSQKVSFR